MCSINLCVREGPLEIVYVANFEIFMAQVQYFGLFMAELCSDLHKKPVLKKKFMIRFFLLKLALAKCLYSSLVSFVPVRAVLY